MVEVSGNTFFFSSMGVELSDIADGDLVVDTLNGVWSPQGEAMV